MKEETSQKRNEETTKLLDYGFTNYKIKTIVSMNDNIGSVYIFNSKKENYDLSIKRVMKYRIYIEEICDVLNLYPKINFVKRNFLKLGKCLKKSRK